jgi:hypothetical protein
MSSILRNAFEKRDLISSLLLLMVTSLTFIAPMLVYTTRATFFGGCTHSRGDLISVLSRFCGEPLDAATTPGNKEWKNLFNSLVSLLCIAIFGVLMSFANSNFDIRKKFYILFRTVLVFVIFVVVSVSVSSVHVLQDKLLNTNPSVGYYFMLITLVVSILGLLVLFWDCWILHKNGEFFV